mmetsp:Transcript_20342/g.28184  ORF Transcript_20342/g.28184 Transcript_20342/m.28184 type:complete len:389 (+) Transcript_20342:2-1168(+)
MLKSPSFFSSSSSNVSKWSPAGVANEMVSMTRVLASRIRWWVTRTYHAGLDSVLKEYTRYVAPHASSAYARLASLSNYTNATGPLADMAHSAAQSACQVVDQVGVIWGKAPENEGAPCGSLELLLAVLYSLLACSLVSFVYHLLVVGSAILFRTSSSSSALKAKSSVSRPSSSPARQISKSSATLSSPATPQLPANSLCSSPAPSPSSPSASTSKISNLDTKAPPHHSSEVGSASAVKTPSFASQPASGYQASSLPVTAASSLRPHPASPASARRTSPSQIPSPPGFKPPVKNARMTPEKVLKKSPAQDLPTHKSKVSNISAPKSSPVVKKPGSTPSPQHGRVPSPKPAGDAGKAQTGKFISSRYMMPRKPKEPSSPRASRASTEWSV